MISRPFHAERRKQLSQLVNGPVLLMGMGHTPRNIPMNHLPFRQDSSFLYFTGCDIPHSAAVIEGGKLTLFVPEPAPDDALWHGKVLSMSEIAQLYGADEVKPRQTLGSFCSELKSPLKSTPCPDPTQNREAEIITGQSLSFGKEHGNPDLVHAIVKLRRNLQTDEINEMKSAMKVTKSAHCSAMAATFVGSHEQKIASVFNAVISQAGLQNAYSSIVTTDGQILHNFHYTNSLKSGKLLLLDGGSESKSGYATDITRTWPVNGRFSPRQRAAYEATLHAQKRAIDALRPGIRYRDVHDIAAYAISEFLIDEGILNISASESVERGAYALVFPHGVGHLIGLDVHDLENYGDLAAYPQDRERSKLFGPCYLRLDLDLESNMAVTIEPGFYISKDIINSKALRTQFQHDFNWAKFESWMDFGGIRIEDDVLITDTGHEVLSKAIPKELDEIESLVGSNRA